MKHPFEAATNTGHTVTSHIFVKADGKTVCESTDKEVAELKYAKGSTITEAQKAALIFPGQSPEPTPDAEHRSAEHVPDAEKRHVGKHRK
jgi:hypothetical protein